MQTNNYVSRDTYGMYKDYGSSGPGPALMGADTLLGNDVCNERGENLGNIKEFMIDMASGRIAYAVLSSRITGRAWRIPPGRRACTVSMEYPGSTTPRPRARCDRAPGANPIPVRQRAGRDFSSLREPRPYAPSRSIIRFAHTAGARNQGVPK
jgi:sporulation protein YlmC with PRC-barrel domain